MTSMTPAGLSTWVEKCSFSDGNALLVIGPRMLQLVGRVGMTLPGFLGWGSQTTAAWLWAAAAAPKALGHCWVPPRWSAAPSVMAFDHWVSTQPCGW